MAIDTDKLEAVAWMYTRHDSAVEYWPERRFDGALHGAAEKPLTDMNRANEIIAEKEAEIAAIIEKAAQVAEGEAGVYTDDGEGDAWIALRIAEAIRALKEPSQ